MSLKVAWNRKENASVILSKIKEFTITQNTVGDKYTIRGWFNRENSFIFGDDFETLPVAQKFLNNIHNKI